jgi:beta-N-acetylhexosaminidase
MTRPVASIRSSTYHRDVQSARPRFLATVATFVSIALLVVTAGAQEPLDREAQRWADETLARLTLDEKVGQLIVPSFFSQYTSSDSDVYTELTQLIHGYHIGGIHVFGARDLAPDVLLNPTYARASLGHPLAAASLVNRLQAIAPVPLLVTADFETGVGFRMEGATTFPRAMAFGAAGDPRLAYEAGRITALEARAIGVHVNFAPVVDVNNNPRNPVINTRSFGEDPERVGRMAAAYIEGLNAGGALATIKHFPGHGDTDVDSHRGLPIIEHSRERLDRVELPPFRAGIAAGAAAVMTGHIQLPELEPAADTPATFSHRIATGLLREELGFDGLVFTDSMRMSAVSEMVDPAEAAARAVAAGHDIVLHSPDNRQAFAGIKDAVARGEVSEAQLDSTVHRILSAKAGLGLHRTRAVSLDTLPLVVGTRAHRRVARDVSERSLTLIRDEARHVPLPTPRDGAILYLSILDHPSGWGVGAPSRTVIPELRERWPNVTAIELSDDSSMSEIELVRETAGRYAAVVAGVFVRTASFSGRMDLTDSLVGLLESIARDSARDGRPFVTLFFGSPYAATFLADLPAMLLTYDFYDLAEASAVRALAGEVPIGGRLPVALGDRFPLGHGLDRAAP